MAYRTLGDLRATLRARLGFGAQGSSGGANQVLLDSFLQNAQVQLYWLQDWRHLIESADFTTGVGQTLHDFPAGCERDRRVMKIEVEHAGQWVRICEGITTAMRSTVTSQSVPARFERFAQLELYPQADAAYTVRVWYVRDLGAFVEDDDPATLDDQMILLHAIANGKAHYRHPDAQVYEGQLNTLLSGIRGQSFSTDGVYRRGVAQEPERKPALLGRDV
jgi:hypothetical protein